MALSYNYGISPWRILRENCSGLRRSSVASLKEISLLEWKRVCSAFTCLLSSELTLHRIQANQSSAKISIWEAEQWGITRGRRGSCRCWGPMFTLELYAECWLLRFFFLQSVQISILNCIQFLKNTGKGRCRGSEDTVIVSWEVEITVYYGADIKISSTSAGDEENLVLNSMKPFPGLWEASKRESTQTSLGRLENPRLRWGSMIATTRSCKWT